MANPLVRLTRRLRGRTPFDLTFCVGAPRSGTTLMASLLSEGDACTPMLPECTYVTHLIRQHHDMATYADPQRYSAYARSPEILLDVYRKSVDAMIGVASSHFPWWRYERMVLKDPLLTTYLDRIPLFFGPDVPVVCVIRDPRDVIASLCKVYVDDGREFDTKDVIEEIFQFFWAAHESELVKSGRVHCVCFEKILAKDEEEFQHIEAYLGYDIGREGFANVFFQPERNDSTYSDNFGKPITPVRSNKAATMLDECLVQQIETTFSGYNEKYAWW